MYTMPNVSGQTNPTLMGQQGLLGQNVTTTTTNQSTLDRMGQKIDQGVDKLLGNKPTTYGQGSHY